MKFKKGFYITALWIFLLVGVKCKEKVELEGFDMGGYTSVDIATSKSGYFINQGEFRGKMNTWIWSKGQIIHSWEDSLKAPASLREARIQQAKEYIAWHKTLKDTTIYIK